MTVSCLGVGTVRHGTITTLYSYKIDLAKLGLQRPKRVTLLFQSRKNTVSPPVESIVKTLAQPSDPVPPAACKLPNVENPDRTT
jgi:hypothetical protein